MKRFLLSFLFACSLMASESKASPIVNGGFEDGLTGWNQSAIGVGFEPSFGLPDITFFPTEGNLFGVLVVYEDFPSDQTYFSQVITVPGGSLLSFDYNLVTLFGLEDDIFEVSLGDITILTLNAFSVEGDYTGWLTANYISLNDTTATLAFTLTKGSGPMSSLSPVFVDNIKVGAIATIPEPTSGMLLLSVLIILSLVRMKSHKV